MKWAQDESIPFFILFGGGRQGINYNTSRKWVLRSESMWRLHKDKLGSSEKYACYVTDKQNYSILCTCTQTYVYMSVRMYEYM